MLDSYRGVCSEFTQVQTLKKQCVSEIECMLSVWTPAITQPKEEDLMGEKNRPLLL